MLAVERSTTNWGCHFFLIQLINILKICNGKIPVINWTKYCTDILWYMMVNAVRRGMFPPSGGGAKQQLFSWHAPSHHQGAHIAQPGKRIISDMWKAYDCLQDEGNVHLKVNHSLNFPRPRHKSSTQKIGSHMWARSKTKFTPYKTIGRS